MACGILLESDWKGVWLVHVDHGGLSIGKAVFAHKYLHFLNGIIAKL